MQSRLSTANHRKLFLLGMLILMLGFGWGAVFLSVGITTLGFNWLWEGQFARKWARLKSSRLFWVVSAVYLLHIVGLVWTHDFKYGIKDVQTKIPLLALPLIFASSEPLQKRELILVLRFFVLAIIASSCWSMVFYFGWRPLEGGDVRKLSRFDSHIRLSLVILFAICTSTWFLFRSHPKKHNYFWLIAIAWLLTFLFLLSSLNGIAILLLLLISFTVFSARVKNNWLRLGVPAILLMLGAYLFYQGKKMYDDFFTARESALEKLEDWSPTGDIYFHERDKMDTENGFFVWRYVAYPETKREWNRRSRLHFDSLDKHGMPLRFTVIRYITSLGMRKDSIGVSKLSIKDIENIEAGVTNYKLAGASPLTRRLYDFFWEINDYLQTGSISKHSLAMKLEYWRMATRIISKNPLCGVGTGDVQQAFSNEYIISKSKLVKEEDRRRAHNQFLEIAVAIGIPGALFFVFSLFYPFIQRKKKFHVLYLPFFLILFFSMFPEDTLETHLGNNIFAFFNSLFLFLVPAEEDSSSL